MIGRLDPSDKDVTILGGGIAGLAAAYFLQKNAFRVTLHEKSSRFGGLIATEKTPSGLAEHAASSIRADARVLRFLDEIGCAYDVANPKARAKFIFRDGKLSRFPLTFRETLVLFSRALRVPAETSTNDLASFATRHFGPAARDYLFAPLATGIYASGPECLLQPLAFPRLNLPPGKTLVQTLLQKRKRQEELFIVAPRLGMGTLVEQLVSQLRKNPNVRLHLKSAPETLPRGNVILAVPAAVAASYLRALDVDLAQALARVQYTSLTSATVFFRRTELKKFRRGIGVLFPPVEQRPLLGILFSSETFPNRARDPGTLALTCLLKPTNDDLEIIRQTIASELQRIFRVTKIQDQKVFLHHEALPIYNQHLETCLTLARSRLAQGLVLSGNYAGDISIRGLLNQAQALGCFASHQ